MGDKMAIDLVKVKADFVKLEKIAEHLNEISNRFNEPIDLINDALNGLRLGAEAHYNMDNDTKLSYCRIFVRDNKQLRCSGWGMVIVWKKESWAYNQAPRFLRIKCVSAIPFLVEELVKQADGLVQDLEKQTIVAQGWNKQIQQMSGNKNV